MSTAATTPQDTPAIDRKVYVVDDDPMLRSSVERIISRRGYVVETYESGEAFLDNIDQKDSGCVLIDVRMPGGMSGMELLERLRQNGIGMPAVMLTGFAAIADCVQALKFGAVDFLEKPYRTSQLLDAIEAAIEEDAKTRCKNTIRKELKEKVDKLTKDECDVLDGIAEGKIQKNVATELNISLRTVQFRRSDILKKMDVRTNAELLQLISKAKEMGLYPPAFN